MNILYFGDSNPHTTSSHRAMALRRLGYQVNIFNPKEASKKQIENLLLGKIHFRTGYRFLQKKIMNWLSGILEKIKKTDIIWVDGGEFFGVGCLKLLKQKNCPIILYNLDDPTGNRDGRRFDMLLQALSYYDICAVVREINMIEYKEKGAKKVLEVTRSYDEVAHCPFDNAATIPGEYKSKVAFIGTWMRYESRDVFLLKLIENGLPVSIWGSRWQKSVYWKQLMPFHRGDALHGKDYVAAIQGSKICLGMLSKGNRDLHTQRSFEIPYAGGLLCAERTTEHQEMFKENKEAIFWNDAEECAKVCKELLADDTKRQGILLAGMERVRVLEVGNENICKRILDELNS
jgi:spore maturation protein CgeB